MKIGVFDSGYGGLTILKGIRQQLPQYDYLYLGDNARAPYGTRSFELIYRYTWECTKHLFDSDCDLVILACNTASAKALRSIQQRDLLTYSKDEATLEQGMPQRRVLGVIRPTIEQVKDLTLTNHIGLLATPGTVNSESYPIELHKLNPEIHVESLACPMWVPLIENGEHESDGADFFVEKYIQQILQADPQIDTLILGCTHYPMLLPKIQKAVNKYTDKAIKIIAQGTLVGESLVDYLTRHENIAQKLSTGGTCEYETTENAERFAEQAALFLGEKIQVKHVEL